MACAARSAETKEVSKITRKNRNQEQTRTGLPVPREVLQNTVLSNLRARSSMTLTCPCAKWFMAIALMIDAKKGMSALATSAASGSELPHRLVSGAPHPGSDGRTWGIEAHGNIVEIDETYIGGKQRGHKSKLKNKDVVLGIRQRGGPLRLVQSRRQQSQERSTKPCESHVDKNVEKIMTDDAGAYNFRITKFRKAKHSKIRHSAERVR